MGAFRRQPRTTSGAQPPPPADKPFAPAGRAGPGARCGTRGVAPAAWSRANLAGIRPPRPALRLAFWSLFLARRINTQVKEGGEGES